MADPGAGPTSRAAAARRDESSAHHVRDVEVDRDAGEMRVQFADGEHARFGLLELRLGCPCAGCRGRREAGADAFTGDQISVRDAELHGNWGIALRWSDGHDTGIYAWSYLRRWWEHGARSLP